MGGSGTPDVFPSISAPGSHPGLALWWTLTRQKFLQRANVVSETDFNVTI